MNSNASQLAARLIVYVPARGRMQYCSNAEGTSFTKDRSKAHRFSRGAAFAIIGRVNGGQVNHCHTCFADL